MSNLKKNGRICHERKFKNDSFFFKFHDRFYRFLKNGRICHENKISKKR